MERYENYTDAQLLALVRNIDTGGDLPGIEWDDCGKPSLVDRDALVAFLAERAP